MEQYLALLHWVFLAASLLIAALTEFIKRILKMFPQNKWTTLFMNARIVPAVLGLLLGLIPGIPVPDLVGDVPGIAHMLYFGTAGIISAWVYSLVQKIFKEILPDKFGKFLDSKAGKDE